MRYYDVSYYGAMMRYYEVIIELLWIYDGVIMASLWCYYEYNGVIIELL